MEAKEPAMIELNGALQEALHAHKGGEPLRVLDPQTKQAYVLLPAEDYERLRQFAERTHRLATLASAESGGVVPATGEFLRVKVRDLSTPAVVAEEVTKYCRRLGFWRRKYVRQAEDMIKLQYYFGGQYVAYLSTEDGPVVVAAGDLDSDAFDRQLACLTPEERRAALLHAVDPWNDPISRIFSHLSSDEG
jgi:hypothetical protein